MPNLLEKLKSLKHLNVDKEAEVRSRYTFLFHLGAFVIAPMRFYIHFAKQTRFLLLLEALP